MVGNIGIIGIIGNIGSAGNIGIIGKYVEKIGNIGISGILDMYANKHISNTLSDVTPPYNMCATLYTRADTAIRPRGPLTPLIASNFYKGTTLDLFVYKT